VLRRLGRRRQALVRQSPGPPAACSRPAPAVALREVACSSPVHSIFGEVAASQTPVKLKAMVQVNVRENGRAAKSATASHRQCRFRLDASVLIP
jgi:hypothetical protein